MNEERCEVPEERWVDLLLGHAGDEAAAALKRHALGCAECRRVRDQWAELLASEPDLPAAPAKEGVRPNPGVYRSLRRRLRLRSAALRLRGRSVRIAAGLAGAAAAVCLIYLLAVSPGAVRSSVSPEDYALLHEPEGAKLMTLPGTRTISLSDFAGWPEASYPQGSKPALTVWINEETGNVFVFLEGLTGSEGLDVQAWQDGRSRLASLGLLEFHRDQGHLYTHVRAIGELETLQLSIEPKGGSDRPTGPDIGRISLDLGLE